MDPITELLSQLSGVRRAATLVSGGPSVGAIGSGTASRLQQLQVSEVLLVGGGGGSHGGLRRAQCGRHRLRHRLPTAAAAG